MELEHEAANFRLVPTSPDGHPANGDLRLSDSLSEIAKATQGLYEAVGYDPPWISYYSIADSQIVGGGAFVGSPSNGRIEIAYFTLPEHQGRGYATRTAMELVQLVRSHGADLKVWAKTRPEAGPSTRVLSRLGFYRTGVISDHEIGPAWAWELVL